jgi:hypothetical protein
MRGCACIAAERSIAYFISAANLVAVCSSPLLIGKEKGGSGVYCLLVCFQRMAVCSFFEFVLFMLNAMLKGSTEK